MGVRILFVLYTAALLMVVTLSAEEPGSKDFAKMGLSDNLDCRMSGEDDERMNYFGTGYPEPKEFRVLPPTSIIQFVTYYMSLERINVTYCNPDFGFLNATSARPGRWDHKYYVRAYMRTLKTFDNNVKVDFLFYEFLSNEYRRGFVEMHFNYCDFVRNDPFFGSAIRANVPDCPLPPGEYYLSNMSVPDLPVIRSFPFRKGRVYAFWSLADVHIFDVYADIEIKTKPKSRAIKVNKNKTSLI